MRALAAAGRRLRSLDSVDMAVGAGAPGTEITVDLVASTKVAQRLEEVVGRLAIEPLVTRARWTDVSEGADRT